MKYNLHPYNVITLFLTVLISPWSNAAVIAEYELVSNTPSSVECGTSSNVSSETSQCNWYSDSGRQTNGNMFNAWKVWYFSNASYFYSSSGDSTIDVVSNSVEMPNVTFTLVSSAATGTSSVQNVPLSKGSSHYAY